MAERPRVLVVNAGSSSLKLSLVQDGEARSSTTVERWAGATDRSGLHAFVEAAGRVDAVGHRVVHGGPGHRGAARVDVALLEELTALTDLAPLHQPRSLAAVRATTTVLPRVPAYACFDTAFHRTLPAAASTYGLPAAWNTRWCLRRYGFHGLSHEWAATRGAQLVGARADDLRTVTCHLGAGASVCAVLHGTSVDTSMGFTPLDGLVMATRSGSVDPGLLLWLLEHHVSRSDLAEALNHRSGLAGLSGTSGDLRDVLAARADGSAAAGLAYDVFVHRLAKEVAGMCAATGGLDLLVLTGGIGEHSPEVRRDLCARLAFLGVRLDEDANAGATTDTDLSAEGSVARVVVVTAREDLVVAREVEEQLAR